MKTLVLALLIPLAICTACSKKEESTAVPSPESIAAPAAPVAATMPVAAPAPVDAATKAPVAGTATPQGPISVHVSLIPAAGSAVTGDLTLSNEGTGVSIVGQIHGLEPGKEHGFHVHEVGECLQPDFKSAGGHFNPTKDPHGGPKSKARHLGDIPNARADENGRTVIDVIVTGATLGDKDAGPAEIFGKSLIVHAMPDDYKTQPSGNSGARIACGVIR